jgi:hypothetical protein
MDSQILPLVEAKVALGQIFIPVFQHHMSLMLHGMLLKAGIL